MPAKVIELFGGPGCGKTTLSLELCLKLKKAGKNVELVREYVKDWAWENRKVGRYDQIYISAKQCKKEYFLYDKVDYIVTDSPIMLGPFYMQHYQNKDSVSEAVKGVIDEAAEQGVQRYSFLLQRHKRYNPAGRYETEEEAKIVDQRMMAFLDLKYPNYSYLTCHDEVMADEILDLVCK